ncbi:diguanylate cyclase domain-containing protein [Janthinobacterium sp.]|uniref:sensor domain-containing diguanylate cyclase n=1 Tax=Janthinobacterium sp. TaxID=1871054 RepID=UPI0028972314|nr:diguanylate cyclase [Janthinobacterium sp.]
MSVPEAAGEDAAASHEALLQFLYMAPVGLVQTDADGNIGLINPVSAQLLMPLSRDGSLENLFDALGSVAPDLRHLAAAFAAPNGIVCDGVRIQLYADSSKSSPQFLSLSLIKLDGSRLMAVLADVTQQVRRDRQLRQSDAWLNAILTGISDYALVSLDQRGRINEWNDSIGRVTGFGADAALDQPYSLFDEAGATTAERLADRLREADANGWSLDEGWRVKADGSRFWGSAMISPLPDRESPASALHEDTESAYCLVMRDISDKREASERYRQARDCDYLTGIANRRAFFEAAERELERSLRLPRPIVLLLFDADHFKAVNDRHGHPAGDAVLVHLATSLVAAFRPSDLVARIGGEEFAVLLPSTSVAVAQELAARFCQRIAGETVQVDGVPISYTVSGGMALAGDGAQSLDLLLRRAGQALAAARTQGRNRIACWKPDLSAAGTARSAP